MRIVCSQQYFIKHSLLQAYSHLEKEQNYTSSARSNRREVLSQGVNILLKLIRCVSYLHKNRSDLFGFSTSDPNREILMKSYLLYNFRNFIPPSVFDSSSVYYFIDQRADMDVETRS